MDADDRSAAGVLNPRLQRAAPKQLGDLVGGYVVESGRPLPESALWAIQRSFYETNGGQAWAGGSVPHYITCNPGIARGYAQAVLGFARDCRAAGELPSGAVLRILEVGGGSGRFAALLLHWVTDLLATSSLADVEIRYILTDFNDSRLREFEDHPGLAGEREAGRLRLLLMDAADPAASGAPAQDVGLGPGERPGPLVVVANYVLDSLPQECVALRDRQVHRGLLTTTSPRRIEGTPQPTDLADLDFAWDFDPTGGPEGLDPHLDDLLSEYATTLDDTVLLLPTAAVECLRVICRERATPTLALLADKGTTRRRDLLGLAPPGLALHGGCFSFMVNFDALAGVVQRWGGLALHPPDRAANLVVAAYLLPGREASVAVPWPETALAYAGHLGTAGPDDWFLVHGMLGSREADLSIEQALAVLRVSWWDPAVFLRLAPALLELAPQVPESLRADVVRALRGVWAAHVPIGEGAEVATLIGLVLGGMRCHREALAFFDRALAEHGRSANALFGSALAHADLGDRPAAQRSAVAALEVDPSFGAARALLVTLAEEA